MAKNVNYVSHKKSKLKNQDGTPQLPSASVLVEGEIAINFAENVETLSIKNESGHVVTFSSDNYYSEKKLGSGFTGANSANTVTKVIVENEKVISTALNDLNERKLDASAYTPTDISNYYQKSETSGKTEISNALDAKVNTSDFNTHTGNTSIHHTHNNKSILDAITSNVGTMAYQSTDSYSSATEVNTALGTKANTTDLASYADSVKYNSTSHYVEFYHGTTAGTKVFEYDASPFIIDGMVQNVEIKDVTSGGSQVTCLVVSFNTDAGKQNINVPISDIFDANNYYQKSETSGATEISNALGTKVNSATYTGHTADTNVHFTANDRLKWETLNRRTRKNFTNSGMTYFINTIKSAIADQDLEKYGLKVGDYYTVTHDGKTYNYVIAGLNTMRGTSTPYRLNYDHVGIIVDTNDTHAWNTSSSTTTSQNTHLTGGTWTSGASAGYASCDLQYYLETTVLPNVESDLGSDNVKSHSKLYSNAVNTNGYNRFGSAGGCSSSWAWYSNQKICALSEVQVYGSIVWSSSGYDTGEACRQLDVFRVYNMNEIFESRYPWLRDVASSSNACNVGHIGSALDYSANNDYCVAALILFA